jgi:translation initiation factor IF-2
VANPRVHEIASEIGVDSKVALAKLKELGEYVKSPHRPSRPRWRASCARPSRPTAQRRSRPTPPPPRRRARLPRPPRRAPARRASRTGEARRTGHARRGRAAAPRARGSAAPAAPAHRHPPGAAPRRHRVPAAHRDRATTRSRPRRAWGSARRPASGQQPVRVGAGHGPAPDPATSRVRRPAPRRAASRAPRPGGAGRPGGGGRPGAPFQQRPGGPGRPGGAGGFQRPGGTGGRSSRRFRRSSRRWRRSWPWSRRRHRGCLRQGRRQEQAAQVASGEAAGIRDAVGARRRRRQRPKGNGEIIRLRRGASPTSRTSSRPCAATPCSPARS